MKRFIRFAKWIGIALGVLLIILLIPLVGVVVECRPFATAEPQAVAANVAPSIRQIKANLPNYTRPADQTYLTFPEWYIVYSADEYARFIAQKPPSHFPYFGAIRQYWQGYYAVCAVTREHYQFNSGYHLMLAVIGSSFTLEELFKGVYENTVGRITEWTSSPELTPEDAYARQVAKEYGDFIHTVPWYEFPFAEKLQGLWRTTGLWGPNPLRKWERKFALSLEYGGKALYGRVLRQGTEATYAPEELTIQAWVEELSPAVVKSEPDVHVVQALAGQAEFVELPRYEAFTQLAPRLAKAGVRFVEIAGNDEILITAFTPSDWTYSLPDGQLLFSMPVVIDPAHKRIAVKAPVRSLHLILQEFAARGIQLEHLYDY